MKKLWEEFKFLVIIFVIWRLGLFFVGLLAMRLLPFKYSFPYIQQILVSSGLPESIWHWANFDGVHYLDIAARGYSADGLQVFFPVYPLVMRIVNLLVNNYIISGLLVSNLSILVAGCLIFRYVRDNFSLETARWSIIFLFAFPTAFFWGNVYTESLFLLLLALSLETSGFMAGVFAGLSGGVRLVGFASGAMVYFNKKRKNWWAALSFAGLGVYVLYLWAVYHRPLGFLESQVAFKNARATSLSHLVSPLQVIFRYFRIFVTASPQHFDYWIAALEFSAFLFGLMVLLFSTFKIKFNKGLIIFSWIAFLLPVFSGTLQSYPRYLLVLLPMYFCLGLIRSNRLKYVIAILFVALQTLLVSLFARGYFVS